MPVRRGASGRGKNGILARAASLPRCQFDIAPALPGLWAPLAATPAIVESTANGLLADLVNPLQTRGNQAAKDLQWQMQLEAQAVLAHAPAKVQYSMALAHPVCVPIRLHANGSLLQPHVRQE